MPTAILLIVAAAAAACAALVTGPASRFARDYVAGFMAGAEQAGRGPRGDDRPDRHAAAQALGQGDDVGRDGRGEQVVGHPGASAPHAGLDLVDDEQGAGAPGQLAGRLQVAGGQFAHARLALDGLDDEGGDVGPHGGGQRGLVPGGDELHPAGQRLEGLAVGGLVGQGQGAHGAPVEGVGQGEDARALRPPVAPRDLEGPLVGLRAGVGQEDPGAGRVGAGEDESDELLGEGDLRRGGEEVRHVPQGAQLRGDGPHHGRVGVAQAIDRDPGEQVGVLGAVGVPHAGAAPAHEDALRGAEGVHDGPPVALRPGPPGSGGRGRLRGGGPGRGAPAPGVDGAHSDCPPLVREHLVCSG